MKAPLTRHRSDIARQRLGCGEFPRTVGTGEDVLLDPILFGSGQIARPVVDDVGESNWRGTPRRGHAVLSLGRPTHSRRRSSARWRATRTTVAVTPSSLAISDEVFTT